MLNIIHESHLGIAKCKARARTVIYWPGMSIDIERLISKCDVCLTHRSKNRKEPMQPHPIPGRPLQKLGSDILEYKRKNFLVVVDYHSKYIETCQMGEKTASSVIKHMKPILARHGIPEEIVADNMPYNSTEFQQFAKDWGFKVTTTSPTYPQSNGMCEKAVQTVKKILKKATDPYIGLLEYRNTPVTGMSYTPTQLLMSRIARTKIPTCPKLLKPAIATDASRQLQRNKDTQKHYYNKGSRTLPPLKPQDHVRVRQGKQWTPAVVTAYASTPRSYIVRTQDGQTYRRNRRDLLKPKQPRETADQTQDDIVPIYQPCRNGP